MKNKLVTMIREGATVIGLSSGFPCAGIVERMCRGWDFVWIDAQHGLYSYDSALEAVRAAGLAGTETVLRVPGHEYGIIGPYADTACSAVMVPMVDTAEQAKDVVDALCFPPLGKRSYGGRRMVDLYGRKYYLEYEQLVIAQIETPEALENIDAIAATKGIGMLFFGPDDMKIRLGIEIDTPVQDNKKLSDAMRKIADTAKKAGIYAGCIAGSPEALIQSRKMGYRLIVCGGDIGFIRSSDRKLEEMRRALDE